MINGSVKINIVLLTDCLADLAGGAEKQIYELAKRLDKNKYNVSIVSLESWGKAPKEIIESTGAKLHLFKVIRIYGLSGLIQGIRFHHFLRSNKIDILLTYHFSSDIWGSFWGHLAGVRTIMSNRRDMGFWRNSWHIKAYQWINPWVNKIIVVSESIKQMVIQTEKVDPQRIEVIYNGVELPYTTEPYERSQIGLKNNDLVIMHVANLKPIKGHRFLLEAFAQIVPKHPNTKLVLIGKDELNGQLNEITRKLDIQDHVIFLGKRDDTTKLLPLADLCTLPSLSEGMSNAVLEYMAAGKASVITDVGGNPELICDQYNGLLVSKENSAELQSALHELIANKDKRDSMGRNSLALVQRTFSMSAMISKYEDLFNQYTLKIRVLHLVSSGGLYGAERVILSLAGQSKNVYSYVGALNNQHNPHLEMIDQAKELKLPIVVFDSKGRLDIRTIFKIKRFLTENNIDILHTHNYKADIVGMPATKLAGRKWIATNHLWHSTSSKLRAYEKIDAFFLRSADKIIGVSEEIIADMVKKGFNKQHLHVIHNGINIGQFNQHTPIQPLREVLGIKPNEIAVSIIGRLAIEKGHDIFLQAAHQVTQRFPHVKFLIVGEGPLKKELENKVNELSLAPHVIFTGIRKDMPAVYALSDILVNSSSMEGLPMTILEAMAAKLPMIVTAVGAVPQVITDQRNGVLLKPNDPNILAEAIIDLVNNPQKRIDLAEQAYQDVNEHFSDERMAQDYAKLYQEIL